MVSKSKLMAVVFMVMISDGTVGLYGAAMGGSLHRSLKRRWG